MAVYLYAGGTTDEGDVVFQEDMLKNAYPDGLLISEVFDDAWSGELLDNFMPTLKKGDRLVVTEFGVMSWDDVEVMHMINDLVDRGVTVHEIKSGNIFDSHVTIVEKE